MPLTGQRESPYCGSFRQFHRTYPEAARHTAGKRFKTPSRRICKAPQAIFYAGGCRQRIVQRSDAGGNAYSAFAYSGDPITRAQL